MQDGGTDQNDGVAGNDENREPYRKFSVIGIALTPIANAQGDDAAQEQPFIGDRIENNAQPAALVITAGDISIETVARGREKKDDDGSKTLPFQRITALNAFAVVNRQGDKHRNHQNPNDRHFVGGSHWRRRSAML